MNVKLPSIKRSRSISNSPFETLPEKKCNIKNAICLNKKRDYCKFSRDVKNVMKNNQQILKLYSYHNNKHGEEHGYNVNLQKKNNTLKIIIGDADGWNDKIQCLTMTFYKPNKNFTTFESSKIHQINKGMCGKGSSSNGQKTRVMSGGYILNLANKFNDLLQVKFSKLQDDSKIVVKNCSKNDFDKLISLKIVHLIKYGKTWYEREGGYSLDEKKYYDIVKVVEEQTLSSMLDYALNNFNRDIGESQLNEKNLLKLDKILEKLNVGRNIKMKNLFLRAYSSSTPLSLCEQYILYKMSILVPYRKMAKTNTVSKDEHYNYNKLQQLSTLHVKFSDSTRIGKKKIEIPCNSNSLPPI